MKSSKRSRPPGSEALATVVADRLHEDVCQLLSATSYLAAVLKRDLEARNAKETIQAEEVCAGLRDISRSTRDLITFLRTEKT